MAKKAKDPDAEAGGEVARWVAEIRLYEREAGTWETRSKKIVKRYKDERGTNDRKFRFNILWSNVQTLSPALFANNPKPNVERRFQDDDDTGRIASEVIERCCSYFMDEKYFDCTQQAVLDRLLCGRGTLWMRYNPQFGPTPDLTDDEEEAPQEPELYGEEVCSDYVHWQDFGCTWARTWEEVRAVWRRVFMTREEMIQRFGDKGKTVPLDHKPEKLNDTKVSETAKKATIYEIWDKPGKTAIFIHKDVPQPLDIVDDPLKLKEFFPCPKPLFATLANDTIIPVPDYIEYQDQAQEIDDITARINAITKAIKVAGVYDSSAQGVERLLAEGVDNKLIPISQWAMFAEKGGLNGVISFLPLKDIVQALEALYAARDKVKHDLYEISGMSDIIRGEGDANETATGVKAKGQFATLRLNAMQGQVSRFCRDSVRIMGEIICTHFSLQSVMDISGIHLLTMEQKQAVQQFQQMAQMPQQPGMPPQPPMQPPLDIAKLMADPEKLAELMQDPTWEEVHALMTNDTMRCFRIDIEVDSTIKADQEAERQNRVEFLQAAGGFIQQAVTIPNPELMPLLMQMLMFGVRGFHAGKDLESAFEVAMKKIQNAADNPQPKPNPDVQKIQAQGQLDAQLENMKHQNAMQAQQGDIAVEQAKAAKDAEFERARAAADQTTASLTMAHDRAIEDMKIQHEQTRLMLNRELEHLKMTHASQMQDKQHAHEKTMKAAEIQSSEKQSKEKREKA